MNARIDFWVLIEPAKDVPGEWTAHCLNLDIVSQGRSPVHAREMIAEAVLLSMNDDIEAGRDPLLGREAAPDECWKQLEHVLTKGQPLTTAGVVENAGTGAHAIFATMLHFKIRAREIHEPLPHELGVPPAWMLPTLERKSGAPMSA